MIKRVCDLKPGDEIRWWGETATVETTYTDNWGYTRLGLSTTICQHLMPQNTRVLVVGNMADEVERFLTEVEYVQAV